uniref:Methyltransferase domain-containing protein n=1 Tax=Thermofilum pendens TaxID=2269 RepID=A0A7C1TB39_THEPE
MPALYLVTTRCLDVCSLSEVAALAEEHCGCKLLDAREGILKLSCESEEAAVLCALRANCVREVLREVAVFPWGDLDDRFSLEKLLESVANAANSLRRGRSPLRLCIEFYDPQGKLRASTRENIAKAILAVFERKGVHTALSRALPDLTIWIGALDSIVVGLKLQSVKGDRFEPRAPGKRVYERPFALRVELARLLVNLSSPLPEGPLLDPFCGTGSILIEAVLEGIYAVGVDIDYNNVRGARRNAQQLGVYHSLDIILSDSELMPFRDGAFAAAAFDPPYGRAASSRNRDPALVLAHVLGNLRRVLKGGSRAAFLAPSNEGYSFLKNLASKICSLYVHGSLTRDVWVLEGRR